MGARGPLPKPDARRQGHRESSLVVVEPRALAVEPPRAPAGLLKPARDAWDNFWMSPVASAVNVQSDLPQLVRWVRALDEIARCEPVFRKKRVVAGSQGQPVLNPLGDWIAKQDAIAARIEAKFGMTSADRARLGLVVATGKLTAEQLNQMLERRPRAVDPDAEPEEWEADFTDA